MDEKGKREHLERLAQVYLAIISRYSDYIEEKEGISVAELPTLVTPRSDKVAARADAIKETFPAYSYEKDFEAAALAAFDFVKNEIDDAMLPVQFWLSPEDTLTFMMGDSLDKNILLCSLLIALGNPSAKVFVRIRDGSMMSLVYYEHGKEVKMLDLKSGAAEHASKESMIKSFNIDDDTTAYEFNNQVYADIY
ncbi:MAG: hypothetical protein KGH60_03525 [Candidatus Micrarchaeota archaeon]|nr:hypothetical protein [Candidatus Micrarchaeota archaeon]